MAKVRGLPPSFSSLEYSRIQGREWLIHNLPQGHKLLNASLHCNPEDFCCSLETLGGGVKKVESIKKKHLSQFRISFT